MNNRLALGLFVLSFAWFSAMNPRAANAGIQEKSDPGYCVAIRGNGPLITAHFAALARLYESYGPMDAAAGGSSASISIFLAESMQINPELLKCDGAPCMDNVRNLRLGLLMKSLEGYLGTLASSDMAAGFGNFKPLITLLQNGPEGGILNEDQIAAAKNLLTLLRNTDARDLINPEIFTFLEKDIDLFGPDIIQGILKLTEFATDTNKILFRPGLLDFGYNIPGDKSDAASLPEKIGRVGSFYAGYGPADADAMQLFLTECAVRGAGKRWTEVAALSAFGDKAAHLDPSASRDTTCGNLFSGMVKTYRAALTPDVMSRIDDSVGDHMQALVATSILEGASEQSWESAFNDYSAGKDYNFIPDFSSVRFGYFGRPEDLTRVGENQKEYDDLKTAKFRALGPATWRTALTYSPSEPGLSRALPIDDKTVSAGGWSDLFPTLVLKNLGCDAVVYVTSRGEEKGFALGMSTLLGASDEELAELYGNTQSAFQLSIDEADAVYCTNWNVKKPSDIEGIVSDAFNAPMKSTAAFFTKGKTPYKNISVDVATAGCSTTGF